MIKNLTHILNRLVAQGVPDVEVNCCCYDLGGQCGGKKVSVPCGFPWGEPEGDTPSIYAGCEFKKQCYNEECLRCVCQIDPFCCNESWDSLCAQLARGRCQDQCRCQGLPRWQDEENKDACKNRSNRYEDIVDSEGCVGACCLSAQRKGDEKPRRWCKETSEHYCSYMNGYRSTDGWAYSSQWLGLGSACNQCGDD